MGDPVGNFHYVEKRLKQGITVSRGGEGGGGVASNRNPKETSSRCRNGLMDNVSKEERKKKPAIRIVITIQQWYITMENRNNLTRPKSYPSCRASLSGPIASTHKSEDREL